MFLDQYIREGFDSTEDVVLITGGAVGVDEAVELYCLRRGIKNLIVHPRWLELEHKVNGKNPAGVIRNQYMIDLASEFFAFWDGSSPGTKDAIRRAKEKGIVQEIFSVQSLRKKLKVRPPIKVVLPNRVDKASLHLRGKERISDLIQQAGLVLPKVKSKSVVAKILGIAYAPPKRGVVKKKKKKGNILEEA
jgi:hypothetical protein